MGLLFVDGIREVFQDGLDLQKGLVVGVALALGVGLGNGSALEGVLGETWSASLGNGMTVGVLAAVLLTAFLELRSSPCRSRARPSSAEPRHVLLCAPLRPAAQAQWVLTCV